MNIQKKKGKKKSPRNPTHYELCGCRTRGLVTPYPPRQKSRREKFQIIVSYILTEAYRSTHRDARMHTNIAVVKRCTWLFNSSCTANYN